MENRAIIEDYLSETRQITEAISVEDIDKVIRLLYQAWQDENQVFICGNGGSASTATHFTCDLAKTTIVDGMKRFKAICLNDNVPLVSALTNDEGFDNLYYEQLRSLYCRAGRLDSPGGVIPSGAGTPDLLLLETKYRG